MCSYQGDSLNNVLNTDEKAVAKTSSDTSQKEWSLLTYVTIKSIESVPESGSSLWLGGPSWPL